MRLDAEHDKWWRQALLLVVAVAAGSGGACTKNWVLGPETGAGGAGGTTLPTGSGGFTFPVGTGGFPGDHGGTGGGGAPCTTPSGGTDIPQSNVLFMVGRNASMATRLSGSGDSSRMATVQSQLKTLIGMYQYGINFGYLGFPALAGCSSGIACCSNGTNDGYAPPQGGAAVAITGMLTSCSPGTSTTGCTSLNEARPVAQSLQAAEGAFSSSPKNGDSLVILIADGAPGCPTDDPATRCGAETQ